MADVYEFNVKLKGLEHIIWRNIEVTSVSTVAKLGYAIQAAFNANGSHLFNITYNGKRYEILFEQPEYVTEPIVDPIRTKLSALKLTVGHVLTMEYDYGASWEFTIELLSITEMKRGAGTHYPYVTAGAGKGIIEDFYPQGLAEIIEKTNKEGVLPQIVNYIYGKEMEWDYRDFNLKYCNVFLKDKFYIIKQVYEEIYEEEDDLENGYIIQSYFK